MSAAPGAAPVTLESLLADTEPWSPPTKGTRGGPRPELEPVAKRPKGPPAAHRRAAANNAITRAAFDEILHALGIETAEQEKALGGLWKASGGGSRSDVGQSAAAQAANWSERSQREHQQPALDAFRHPAMTLERKGRKGRGVSRYDFSFIVEALGRIEAERPATPRVCGPVARRVLAEMLAERGVTVELAAPRPPAPPGDDRPEGGRRRRRRTHGEREAEYIERRGALTYHNELADAMGPAAFARFLADGRRVAEARGLVDRDEAIALPVFGREEAEALPLLAADTDVSRQNLPPQPEVSRQNLPLELPETLVSLAPAAFPSSEDALSVPPDSVAEDEPEGVGPAPAPPAFPLSDDTSPEPLDPVAEAERAVDLFASAGCTGFLWRLEDEEGGYRRHGGTKDAPLTADELKRELPGPVLATYAHPWALFVRPYGPVAQLDDRPDAPEVPGEFVEIRTSATSRQRWLQVAEASPDEARAIGRRVARKIGADESATGSTRWPGSRNNKPGRGGTVVRLEALDSVPTSEAELIASGVLDPLPPRPAPAPACCPSAAAERRGLPSYERALDRHRNAKGAPNTHAADLAWCAIAVARGFPAETVERELPAVSDRARRGGAAYIAKTVARALASSWTRRGGAGGDP